MLRTLLPFSYKEFAQPSKRAYSENNEVRKDVRQSVNKFFQIFPQYTFPKGFSLITPKQKVFSIFYIQSGIVRSYLISAKGNDVTINFFSKGAFVPMSWVINHMQSTYFYEAFTEVIAHKVPEALVVRFLKDNPSVTFDLLQRVYKGMEGILLHKEYLVEGNARIKLMYALIVLGKKFGIIGKTGIMHISLDFDENHLASVAGMARETVSRELRRLEKEHIIDYKKKRLTIHNMRMLEEVIQGEIDIF